ncbi:MAG: insulinase family protein [Deltaproteobacteria bacterium]|nr:insulinase family protein [Deltaproteobacteria bacterium]
MKKIFAFALGWFVAFTITVYAQTLQKSPEDESISRHLVLENGMKVLLVSDPEFNVSAAALEVEAGSLMDPEERQGLAHFLEHMLFLGNEKFPDVEEYPTYLERNGGYSNAYTAEDRTNFHMQVQHDAFEGALDRFSHFFIDPLFSPEYIEKEINAVNSEHQKNREQDGWRQFQLLRAFYRDDHPANHFATGDGETLKGVTQEEFLRFYNTYYSANRMSLVLLSNKGLDELESLAREYFLPVKNNNAKKMSYDPDYLDPVAGLRLIKYVPVQDIRELTLTFAIPEFISRYDVKPDSLAGFCIGHEGNGSLLSYLKGQGLATGLSAGAGFPTSDYGTFTINIQLTQRGLEQYRDVIKYCFSYIRILRKEGMPSHVFKEIKHMAELDYTYGNKGEGAERASALAANINRYPIELAETVDYMYKTLDQGPIESLLSYLRPDNMLCMLTAEGLETDSLEPYYGTSYSYTIEKGSYYNSLLDPPLVKELALPVPNPFLPEDVTLLAERPVNLINEPGLELWYAQDTTFKRPKVSLIFHILPPKEIVDAGYMSRLYLYAACINERLNETAYAARMAGLDYGFSVDLDGLTIVINGYEASSRELLNEIGRGLISLEVSEQQFADTKERILREWKNFKLGQAWDVARETSRRIRKETYFGYESLLKEGETLNLADLKEFADTLYDKTRIEALVCGNITAGEAVSLTRLLQSYIPSVPLDKEDVFKQRVLVEKGKDPLTYIERLETNNSCLWRTIHLGSEDAGLRMAAQVIEKFVSPQFYAEMRTSQQLGYIVWTVAPEDNGQYYLFFVVQSESHPADEIRRRADEFIKGLPAEFAAMSDEEFAEIKDAVREGLLEKPKSIGEKSAQFYDLTFDKDEDFDRLQANLDALDRLTGSQVAKILADIVNPDTRKATDILLFAKQHEIMSDTKASFGSIDSFKKSREFVARPEKAEDRKE